MIVRAAHVTLRRVPTGVLVTLAPLTAPETIDGALPMSPATMPPPAAAAPSSDGELPDPDALQRLLGDRLRQVRRARGLTLQDVEVRTDGRWKAVVVGSYERGDRSVSAVRLADLAAFYGVEVTDLLDPDGARSAGPLGRLKLDARRIDGSDDVALAPLARLVAHVRWQRGDHRSSVLAVRHDDLVAVGVASGIAPDDLSDWLEACGVLADPR